MLFSHAQKTLAWDAFAFTEVLLTQPVMVVVGEKVGAFGAYRDGLEVYGRAMVSQDRQLVSLPDFSHIMNCMTNRKQFRRRWKKLFLFSTPIWDKFHEKY